MQDDKHNHTRGGFMDKTQLINTNQQPQAELITPKELENWLGIKAIQQYHL